MNFLSKCRAGYAALAAVMLCGACATINDATVLVDFELKDTVPREAAINYLTKITDANWNNYRPTYPHCKVDETGFVRWQIKGVLTERYEKLNTLPFETAQYYFVLIDNEVYETVIGDKSNLMKGCRFMRNPANTPANTEKMKKIITAFESLGVKRISR